MSGGAPLTPERLEELLREQDERLIWRKVGAAKPAPVSLDSAYCAQCNRRVGAPEIRRCSWSACPMGAMP